MCNAPASNVLPYMASLKKRYIKMQELSQQLKKEHEETLTLIETIISACGGSVPYEVTDCEVCPVPERMVS